MVREFIENREAEVKYKMMLTSGDFNKLPYNDISFFYNKMQEEKAEEVKRNLISASFTAWQIMRTNGYKKSWENHLILLGLKKPINKKIDKTEKEKALRVAEKIQARLGAVKNAK
jgi:hypothetical protein